MLRINTNSKDNNKPETNNGNKFRGLEDCVLTNVRVRSPCSKPHLFSNKCRWNLSEVLWYSKLMASHMVEHSRWLQTQHGNSERSMSPWDEDAAITLH